MKLFIKIIASTFQHATRDKKEMAVAAELGCQVMVVAKGAKNHNEQVEGWDVHFRTTRPLGELGRMNGINRWITIWKWARYVRKLKGDVISCHDILALTIGWVSTWFLPVSSKPLLIYDSHEFELGRNTSGKRGLFKKKILTILEKFLIGKSAITMMVNDSIAQDVQEIYRLEEKPLVVRNIPPYWHINHEVSLERRKAYCQALKAPDNSFILMYHGAITTNRGIEQLISATREIPDCIIILLGFGNDQYLTILKKHISDCKMENRILFLDAVPLNILWEYIGASDVGIMLDQNTCKSYYYSLPNKLFENIQSEKMVIGSNFPEYRQIIEGYNIGLCCNPHDAAEITESIRKIKNNLLLRDQFKNNLLTAKEVLCWENEKEILQTAYSGLLSKIK